MKTREELFNLAGELAKMWWVEIIAIDMLGVLKFYIAQQLSPKITYVPYNEIIKGKDITFLIENAEFNNVFAMDRDQFAMRIENIPEQTFKFSTDYYLFTPHR